MSSLDHQSVSGDKVRSSPRAPVEASCLHKLIQDQVERGPDSTAVVFEGRFLTYGELNCRANRLAHHLGALGVHAETLVAIHMERSLELMVGLLAVLKAGGAYLPLDPHYPRERVRFMLEEAKCPVLLTQSALADRFADFPTKTLCLDGDDLPCSVVHNPEAGPITCELGVRDLHLWIYWETKGGHDHPSGDLQPLDMDAVSVWPDGRGHRHAEDPDQF